MIYKQNNSNYQEAKDNKIKMKQKYQINFENDEVDLLSNQLDPKEMYILGFLKGFDRKTLRAWSEKGLMDFSISVI